MPKRATFSLLLVLSLTRLLAAQDVTSNTPVVVTTGDAVVQRAPDVAYVTLAVETRAKSPRDAQRQNAELMTTVQQRVMASGLPRDAFKTVGLSLRQEFDVAGGRQVPRGYVARNTLDVRINDVASVGETVDTAVQAGATSVDGVRFDLKDRDAVELEALRLAVANARSRADAAAAGAGRTIDRILRIEDARSPSGPPRPVAYMRAVAPDAATPVEAGAIEVQAHVTLTASLK